MITVEELVNKQQKRLKETAWRVVSRYEDEIVCAYCENSVTEFSIELDYECSLYKFYAKRQNGWSLVGTEKLPHKFGEKRQEELKDRIQGDLESLGYEVVSIKNNTIRFRIVE